MMICYSCGKRKDCIEAYSYLQKQDKDGIPTLVCVCGNVACKEKIRVRLAKMESMPEEYTICTNYITEKVVQQSTRTLFD